MEINFSISSPVSSYNLSSNGLVIPSWIDGDYSGNMKPRNEGEEMFRGSCNNMIPLIFDYCEPNGSLQWTAAVEDQENGFYDESSDEFRMYKFKVIICTKESSHDWTECPFAHRGERARRRDPSLYCGETCPDYKKGYCRKGLTCEFSHGLFETWLHPQRYRTQRCKDGVYCNRRVCFFAHSDGELRFTAAPRSPSKLRNTQQSGVASKTVYNSLSSPRITAARYACGNNVSPQPQTYGLGLQQESSPRGVAVPQMIMNCPSPSASSISSGSLPAVKLDCSYGLADIVAALRNVDLRRDDDFNYSGDKSVLQNCVDGSFENGVNCGFHGLESGKDLRPKIYGKFRKDQLKQEYGFCAAADQPDFAWVNELVEEV
ncbi:hypothetical protein KI387_035230 [Taxus chinensis]|uniref:C3H1-type domain-containing protein n=1 Tax=Taxus chinensis TaxID=29808 RepID=A0AA38FP24_TAXCH|nr:hypothetical protein KI387_035230 [Taxus chinensis]